MKVLSRCLILKSYFKHQNGEFGIDIIVHVAHLHAINRLSFASCTIIYMHVRLMQVLTCSL